MGKQERDISRPDDMIKREREHGTSLHQTTQETHACNPYYTAEPVDDKKSELDDQATLR